MHDFVLVKCLSSRKVVARSIVCVLYDLSGAEVPSLLLLHVHKPTSADN